MPLTTLDLNGQETLQQLKRIQEDAEAENTVRTRLTTDGKTVAGSVEFNRSWKNGWGATAYAKAWWNGDRVVGGGGVDVEKKFGK